MHYNVRKVTEKRKKPGNKWTQAEYIHTTLTSNSKAGKHPQCLRQMDIKSAAPKTHAITGDRTKPGSYHSTLNHLRDQRNLPAHVANSWRWQYATKDTTHLKLLMDQLVKIIVPDGWGSSSQPHVSQGVNHPDSTLPKAAHPPWPRE